MKRQTTLANFFNPVTGPLKRNVISQSAEAQNNNNKKIRTLSSDGNQTANITGEFTNSASPQQKERSEKNRAIAKAKLLSKTVNALSSNIGPSWFLALENEFSKDYFKKLSDYLANERKKSTIYPSEDNVYSWTCMCDIKDVKAVILGQDPYHGPNQAHGLAFSVQKGVTIPPSLANMYKELSSDIPGFESPRHGCLKGWAEQGVLLLNAVLTVRSGNANSHKDIGWENLTDAVIRYLNEHQTGLAFLLWGSYAQKKGSFINKKLHLVLESSHPSPLSAHRGFLGCHHFSKANDYLKSQGKRAIDWNLLP